MTMPNYPMQAVTKPLYYRTWDCRSCGHLFAREVSVRAYEPGKGQEVYPVCPACLSDRTCGSPVFVTEIEEE